MSNQPRTVDEVLMDRLAIIQTISQTTAEHLRLMQRHSGMQVLEMRDTGEADVAAQIESSQDELLTCEKRIATLEARLAELDDELEGTRVGGGDT